MPGKKPTVLIVDDNASQLEILSNMLGGLDIKIKTANDGKQALDVVQDQEFFAVITDINMPAMNGYDLALELQGIPHCKGLPIIFITFNP